MPRECDGPHPTSGLALDEHRVKFLPTYSAGGWTPNLRLDLYNPDDQEMDVKEVWFVESHSDVGGSNDPHALSLGLVPLLWMEDQAIDTGLRCRPRSFFGDWTWDNLHKQTNNITAEFLEITRGPANHAVSIHKSKCYYSNSTFWEGSFNCPSSKHPCVCGLQPRKLQT
ncbi:hypothetical protein ARMSODRAFT_428960 [Armillaria solidipes]|uniref:T6SS Phospholipase effector Tle1-like catalytic domain-containing protein n=1 Tax=Armillaria solidipes TaxID=1076256 RepID=A0A2H3B7B1_9AGAR|nr:hypothetical protein ARMSODRAFT_428960 [Armillaria solidipes]